MKKEALLFSAGFVTAPMASRLPLQESAVLPGDFLCKDESGTWCRTEDSEDYRVLAMDRPHGTNLRQWAWLGREQPPPDRSGRLYRITDLIDCLLVLMAQYRSDPEAPSTGLISGGRKPVVGVGIETLADEREYCVRYTPPAAEQDPEYPQPLSLFGRADLLWCELRERVGRLAPTVPRDWELQAPNRLTSMDHTHPFRSLAEAMELISDVKAELDRYAVDYVVGHERALSPQAARVWKQLADSPTATAKLRSDLRLTVSGLKNCIIEIRDVLGANAIITDGHRGYRRGSPRLR